MSKKEIKRLVILNIPYLILGLLATNLGEAWRLAEGTDISAKLLAFFPTVGQAFTNPMPSCYLPICWSGCLPEDVSGWQFI